MNERERGGARRWDDPEDIASATTRNRPAAMDAEEPGDDAADASAPVGTRTRMRPGPMGPNQATESRGDPEGDDPASGAARGAATGAALGTAAAGPVGLVPGAVAGAAAGAAYETADAPEARQRSRLTGRPGSEGTGPDDPRYAPELQPRRPEGR